MEIEDIKNKKYLNEIDTIIDKMIKAEKWAEKLPVFKDVILDSKISGKEPYYSYGRAYKSIYLSWGINRSKLSSGTNRPITNCTKEYDGYFWNIYINTISLYNANEDYGLSDINKNVNVYFYDKLNSTFYVTDEHIESLLEALNDWYIKALILNKEVNAKLELKKLEERLKELKGKK